MYELELLVPGQDGPRFVLGGRVLFVGRGRQCDVVLQDEAVSTRHLAIWSGEGNLFVEDLRSRNGTRLNGRPLQGRAEAGPGDVIELGVSSRLVILKQERAAGSLPGEAPMVEDIASGALFPIRKERFSFGSSASADVYLPGASREEAVLLLHPSGEVWLGVDAEDHPLGPDQVFRVRERDYRLRLPARDWASTRELATVAYPYTLEVTLNGAVGALAVVSHTETGRSLEIHAETRVILLYLLGRRWLEDAESDLPAIERGWLSESEAAVGVWGKGGGANPSSALNVLVWRVRKDLEGGGFDPWCLEKRSRQLRVRVSQVVLGGEAGRGR